MYPVVHYTTYIGISAHALFIPLFWWLGVPAMAAFNVFSVAAWIAARLANQRGYPGTAAFLVLLEVGTHAVLACHYLGWRCFDYYLIPLVGLLLLHDGLGRRTAVIGSVLVGWSTAGSSLSPATSFLPSSTLERCGLSRTPTLWSRSSPSAS